MGGTINELSPKKGNKNAQKKRKFCENHGIQI